MLVASVNALEGDIGANWKREFYFKSTVIFSICPLNLNGVRS